jgi:hypothetical protein
MPASAQELFPGRQITLIAPYAPGGVVDMTARLLAEGFRAGLLRASQSLEDRRRRAWNQDRAVISLILPRFAGADTGSLARC